jgi:hypothetical protein
MAGITQPAGPSVIDFGYSWNTTSRSISARCQIESGTTGLRVGLHRRDGGLQFFVGQFTQELGVGNEVIGWWRAVALKEWQAGQGLFNLARLAICLAPFANFFV